MAEQRESDDNNTNTNNGNYIINNYTQFFCLGCSFLISPTINLIAFRFGKAIYNTQRMNHSNLKL